MTIFNDPDFLIVVSVLVTLLGFSTVTGTILKRRVRSEKAQSVIDNLNDRIRAWWIMVAIFVVSLSVGSHGSIVLFAIMSFLALREYLALAPTPQTDHRVLIWLYFFILPVHYILLGIQWYGFFSVFVPVYAFIGLQIRSALTGISDNFLDRTARIQWGLIVNVYLLSHAPALLMLDIPGYSQDGQNYKLLLFLVLVVQASDVFQYIVGKIFGKHQISTLSPNKTLEGFLGGVALATLLGAMLRFLTPFSFWESLIISLLICLLGFAGGLVMSAIKRDRKVKDFGALLPGHGGMMDRIDSLCFAAPVLFHLVRYWYG